MKIPPKSSRLAHKVLQLLAFSDLHSNQLDVLAEAVVVVEQLSGKATPQSKSSIRNMYMPNYTY